MPEEYASVIAILLLLLFFGAVALYFMEQQRVLKQIHPGNRSMDPGNVWMQLIPVFGMFYQFQVVARIADSIRRELDSAAEKDWLLDGLITTRKRPTYRLGLILSILICCTILNLPILEIIISLAGLPCWIAYWVQIRKYRVLLKQLQAEA